ncbi:hypothetical protein [Staphylococcus succinus]
MNFIQLKKIDGYWFNKFKYPKIGYFWLIL